MAYCKTIVLYDANVYLAIEMALRLRVSQLQREADLVRDVGPIEFPGYWDNLLIDARRALAAVESAVFISE